MLFAAIFTGKPEHGLLRSQYLEAHIRWVDQNKDVVLVAGSLRSEPQDVSKGGL